MKNAAVIWFVIILNVEYISKEINFVEYQKLNPSVRKIRLKIKIEENVYEGH